MVNLKVEPCVISLLPLWASTIAFNINNPSPVPLLGFEANFKNNRGNISLSIPDPVSVTVTAPNCSDYFSQHLLLLFLFPFNMADKEMIQDKFGELLGFSYRLANCLLILNSNSPVISTTIS